LALLVERCVQEVNQGARFGVRAAPLLEIAGKDEPCLAVADYVCGTFRDYVASGRGNPDSYQARNFARLRSKIRLIHDLENGIFYSRRRPFRET